MTRDQDIERVLERWFTEGPTHMPDRLFEYVDQIDRIPQRRRARLLTRFVAMNSTLRLAAAAVVIVIVGVAGAVFLTQPSGVGTQPSQSPSAAPSVSAAPAVVPAELRANWLYKGTHPYVAAGSMLTIGPTQLSFNETNGKTVSSASLVGADRLSLRSQTHDSRCSSGDEGTYTFSLSSDGSTLTLTPAIDTCAGRSGLLAGDWARTSCGADAWCLGALQPGEHSSGLFNPLSSTYDKYTYGQLSYTVPSGWTDGEDWPGNYTLGRPSDPPNTGIYLFRDVVPHSQDESCSDAAATGVERSPAAFADWLSTLPGLVTTEPLAVTIGGRDGFMIDLSVAPDWTHTCPYSEGIPMISTFTDSDPAPGYDWNVGAGGKARYIFLRQSDGFPLTPGGTSLLIDIETSNKAAWDDLVAEAMPIVESFRFNNP